MAITWDGGAGTTNWLDATNWSGDALPGASDDVIIPDLVGTPTISVFGGMISIRSLVSQEKLSLVTGTFTVNEDSSLNAALSISGGTLSGAGDVTVAGNLTWSSGAMTGTGQIIVSAGSTLSISNSGGTLSRTLVNEGTATWSSGSLNLSGGTIQNNGSFTTDSNTGLNVSGLGAFNNAGTFTKLGISGTQFGSVGSVTFNNSGQTNIQGGSLTLNGGTHTGDFSIAASATLSISGTNSFGATSDVQGLGTIQVFGGTTTFDGQQSAEGVFSIGAGTVSFNATTSAGRLNLGTGTITGTGTVTFVGASTWSGGTMTGTGQTIIPAGSTLSINGTGKTLSRSLVNEGTTTWSSGSLLLSAGTFQNNGSFTVDSTSLDVSGVGAFNNAGTFTRLGNGNTHFTSGNATFNNSGLTDIRGGTLTLNGGTHTGDFSIAALAALAISGTNSFTVSSDVHGPGTIQVFGGTTTFDGQQSAEGVFSINGNVSFNATTSAGRLNLGTGSVTGTGTVTFVGASIWSGGTMTGTGQTIIPAASTLALVSSNGKSLDRTLTNYGAATWSGGSIGLGFNNGVVSNSGTLQNNGSFTIESSTTLDVHGVGAFNNVGTFIKLGVGSTRFGAFGSPSTAFNNTGLVDIQAGALELRNASLFNGNGAVASSPSGRIQIRGHVLGDTTNAKYFAPQGFVELIPGLPSERLFEVMGRDVGADAAGFSKNFAIGTLAVASNTRLVDQSDNSPDGGPEGIYVNTLTVSPGVTLNLNGLHVYARTVQIAGSVVGGIVTNVPDGGSISLNSYAPGQISAVGEVDEWTFFGRAGQHVAVILNPGTNGAPAALSPALGYGRIEILDTNNNVIMSGAGTTSGEAVSLLGVSLPTDGLYRIRVSAAPTQPNSIGFYTLSLYDAPVDVAPVVLNQRYFGTIETSFASDRWTFSVGENQAVRFDLVSASNSVIKFRLEGPNGYTAFVGQTADSGVISLPEAGDYQLSVDTLEGYTGSYSFRLEQVSATTLQPNVIYDGALQGSGSSQLFKIQLETASKLLVELDDNATANRNELYVKYGLPPTRSDYDYLFATPAASDQHVLVPVAHKGDWYILLFTESAPNAGDFTLTALTRDVFITHVTPDRGPTHSNLTLTITGAGFDPTTSVSLIASDNSVYPATTSQTDSTTKITATFAAGSVLSGTYTVQVSKPGGQTAVLPEAVTFLFEGTQKLESRLAQPAVLGRHAPTTFYVEYKNTGDAAMPAPIFLLDSADPDGSDRPLFTLAASRQSAGYWTSAVPDGLVNSIQFLGSGATQGILQPGESMRVPVYYAGLQQPWDFSDGAVELSLRYFTVDEPSIIDWDSLKPSVRPDNIPEESWDAVWSNLVAQVGDTWGDYVRMIGDNARYLGNLGQTVQDVSELLAFEIRQAAGLPILSQMGATVDLSLPTPGELGLNFGRTFHPLLSDRYRTSSFGRGWTHNWQTRLTAQPDGTVVISDGGGSERRYQPDIRSLTRHFSEPGDSSQVFRISGSIYEHRTLSGRVTRFLADGRLDYVEDTNGNRITAGYSGTQLNSLTHTSGASISITYNGAGLIDTVTDSAGRQVHYTYDAANEHLMSVQGFDSGVTEYAYNTTGSAATKHALLSIKDSTNHHLYFGYDTVGRLTSTHRDGDAERIDISYDSAGTITIDDGTGVAKLWFDHRNFVARTQDPLGLATYLAYCACGGVTDSSNSAGQATKFTLKDGLVTSATDQLGNSQSFTYGPLATLLSATDKKGNQTRHKYDTRGNLLSTAYADGSSERWTYDIAGNAISFTNRRNQTITYTYNAAGQLTQKALPGNITVAYGYDTAGNLTSSTDSSGTTTYDYDSGDRLTHVAYPTGRSLHYTYDANGRLTRLEDHTGEATNYAYDGTGRLYRLTDAADSLVAEYTYDSAGRLTRKDLGNGTYSTYGYDGAGNVLHLINYDTSGSINSRFDYTYDPLGRPSSMATLEGTWQYTYDALGQLTHAVFTSLTPVTLPNQDLQYAYDPAGNRIRTIENGVTANYTTNNLNQVTSIGGTTNLYDLDGNLVSSTTAGQTTLYFYNIENRLVRVISPSGTWEYEYDALGNRVGKVHNDERTDYLIDPLGLGDVVAEYDDSGALANRYIHGLGLTGRTDAAGQSHFYDFDALGSTAGITGGDGEEVNNYLYAPFGNTLASNESIDNDFEFVGEFGVMQEDNGLNFMRARFYAASWGVFTAVDPLHAAGSHLYEYAHNDPVNLVDPSGLCTPDASDEDPSDGDVEDDFERAVPSAPGPGGYLYAVNQDDGGSPCPCSDDGERAVPSEPVAGGYLQAVAFSVGMAPCDDSPGDGGGDPGSTPSPEGGSGGDSGSTETVQAIDPNQKLGVGFGSAGYVADDALLPYRIDFENYETATAPAQHVHIIDKLSTDFDWTTLEFKEVGFGDNLIDVPVGSQYFHTAVPMTYNGRTFDVEIEMALRSSTGEIIVQFYSIDPTTQLPPDVLTGFLPPEDGTGRGMGYFTYVIRPRAGLTTGTEIRNVASISFDRQQLIATNQIEPLDPAQGTDPAKEALVTIDAGAPTSTVNSLPATSFPSFVVSWSGEDDAGGSGVGSFDVYFSDDGGEFSLWLEDTQLNSAIFSGEVGHTYAFYSVAKDNVGHHENAAAVPDAMTLTIQPPLPDYNANSIVDSADYTLWRKMLGQSGLTPYAGADGDGDGTVDGDDYDVWRAHFGETIQAGSSSQATETIVADVEIRVPNTVSSRSLVLPPSYFGALNSRTAAEAHRAVIYEQLVMSHLHTRRNSATHDVGYSAVVAKIADDALLAWTARLIDRGRQNDFDSMHGFRTGRSSGIQDGDSVLSNSLTDVVDAAFELAEYNWCYTLRSRISDLHS